MSVALTRRHFGALAAALVVPVGLAHTQVIGTEAGTASRALGAFVRIDAGGQVSFRIGQSEMGQGIHTGLCMLLAEELDVPLAAVRYVNATGPEFKHPIAYAQPPLTGEQITGGSLSTRAYWLPLRRAAASARDQLLRAGAARWSVPEGECSTADGQVVHGPTGRRLAYGALVEAASQLAPADGQLLPLKPREAFKLIGQPTRRLDTLAKVQGQATFGIDVRVPGMAWATVRHAPAFGSRVASLDDKQARKRKGFIAAVPFSDGELNNGVVVVADSYWTAKQAAAELAVEWTPTPRDHVSSVGIEQRLRARLTEGEAVSARKEGDAAKVLAQAGRKLDVTYFAPYLAHATMEPMNCTASVKDGRCELWVPTQRPDNDREVAARASGIAATAVKVNVTFLGGGFGRRGDSDYVFQAVAASKAVGRPVQLIWSREEDIAHDYYRPAMMVRHEVALSPDGELQALRSRIAGPGIWRHNRPILVNKGLDALATAGLLEGLKAPNVTVEWAETAPDANIGFWRGVGNSHNVFFTDGLVDELAQLLQVDAIAYRKRLYANPRAHAVLDRVAAMVNWQAGPPPGRHFGVAYYEAGRWGTRVAQVAEISMAGGKVRVNKVSCVVDSGLIVNPNQALAQVQGATLFGLSAALHGRIEFQDGRVQQSNFHDYPVITLRDLPDVEVTFIEGADAPGSIGEIACPPVMAAVANAVSRATGQRVRSLPLSASGLA